MNPLLALLRTSRRPGLVATTASITVALVVLSACGSDTPDPADVPTASIASDDTRPSDTTADATAETRATDDTEPTDTDDGATSATAPSEVTIVDETTPSEPDHTASGREDSGDEATTTPVTNGDAPAAPTTWSSTASTTTQRLAEIATRDLARRLDIDATTIEVVSVEEVTWRDSSVGCPQKDFSYLQVLTPGVRIVLSVDDRTYDYHAGNRRDPFFCADPQTPVE